MEQPVETRDAADAIAAALSARRGRGLLAVDGRSGSGKTEFANRLAAAVPGRARLLHLDDVYPGWAGLSRGCEIAATAVADLLAGREATLPTWDWHEGREGPVLRLPPLAAGDLLIVEGCGALAEPLGRLTGYGVWCEAAEDVRREGALARDGGAWEGLWDAWAAQEKDLTYLREPDLVLRTD